MRPGTPERAYTAGMAARALPAAAAPVPESGGRVLLDAGERAALAPLGLAMGARMFGLFLLLPVVAPYVISIGGDVGLAGLAVGVYGLTQAMMLAPLGWLSDRLGRKPVLAAGLLVFAAGGAMAGYVEHPVAVVVGRAVQGLGAVSAVILASVGDATRERTRAQGMAFVGIAVALAFGAAMVLAVPLAGTMGVDGVFNLTALLGLLAAAVVLAAPVPAVSSKARGPAAISVDVAVLPYCLGVFAIHFTMAALFVVLPLELVAGDAFEASWLLYLMAFVLSLFVAVPLIVLRSTKAGVLAAATACVAAAAPLAALTASSGALYALVVVLALFFAGFNYLEAVLPSRAASLALPGGRGAVMGVYAISQALGVFAGGLVAGRLAGGYNPAVVMVVGAILALSWLPVLYLHKLRKK